MKRTLAIAILLATASPALAQERTLIGGGLESGGFGAPVFKLSDIEGQTALFVGGRGGWIINHTFVLGAGGYGLSNDIDLGLSGTRDIELGYGGLEFEYINSSDNLIHFTVYLLVGGGGVSGPAVEDESVFVFEPAVNGEVNFTTYLRVNAGAGYRWVTGVDSPGTDLNAFYGQITFKFGSF
jgi:hypothetical protein